jgi:hypothetical protein
MTRLLIPLPLREGLGEGCERHDLAVAERAAVLCTRPLPPEGRGRVALLLAAFALSSCSTPNACLANRYDASSPQAQCISGLQLPHNILKDTDPMSGSTAPIVVAR